MTDKLAVLDLFSGIGGFSLGLERTGGFETVAFCEIEDFPRKVLKKHWPEVPCYHDVTTAGFEDIGSVDLVTAGFPCQDISFAGKGAGLSGNNSGLFWTIFRAVCLVGQPRMLLENVAGLLNRGMGEVLGALAAIGNDASWHCISAAAVGAKHKRDRIWIVTDAERDEQPWEKSCVWSFGRMGRVEQSMAWDRDWQDAFSEFRMLDDGISHPVASTDGYRNAVVPQIPELIGYSILEALGHDLV